MATREPKWLRYEKVEDTILAAIKDTPTRDGTSDFVWDFIYEALDNLKKLSKQHPVHQIRLDEVEWRIYQAIDDTPKKRAPKGSKDPVWTAIYAALMELGGESVRGRLPARKKKKACSVGGVVDVRPLGDYRMVAHESPYFIELMEGDRSLGTLTFKKSGDQLRRHKNLLSSNYFTMDGFPISDDPDILEPMAAFADEVFSLPVYGSEFEVELEEDYPEFGPLLDLSDMLRSGDPDRGQPRTLSPKQAKERGDIYKGKKARWVGLKGSVMKIDSELVMPTALNPFNAHQLAAYYHAVKRGDLLEMPVARVHLVDDLESSQLEYKEGSLSRPLRKKDLGKPCAVLTDGNHRAFAAILAGEPYIYVYVLPNGRDTVRDRLEGVGRISQVAGKEWHESTEYFGGGEEDTRKAATKAIAAKDIKTLTRIMRSVNAAPDVILDILRHDSVEYSWALKEQPRLYELVNEEPRILWYLTEGVFDLFVRQATSAGRLKALLGAPVTLRFSKVLARLQRGSSDMRELAAQWPIYLEKYACGALGMESESSDGTQIYQHWDDGLNRILRDVESQRDFRRIFPSFYGAIIRKKNGLQDVTAAFLWDNFARYADAPESTVGAARKKKTTKAKGGSLA